MMSEVTTMTTANKKICMIRIRHLMIEKGIEEKGRPLTSRELAREIAVSPSMISKTLTFEKKSSRVRRGIAYALGARYEYCWGESDPQKAA